MTIVFDPVRRRSTHVESGLAVQWVRDEPPMERRTHFKLIADGIEVPFEGYYDYGEEKIRKQYPDGAGPEFHRRVSQLWELNYSAVNIRAADFDRQLFVNVWQHLAQRGLGVYRVSTRYTEFPGPGPENPREWTCQG